MARVVEDTGPYGAVIDGAGCGGTHGSRPTGHFCRAGPACPAGSAAQGRAGDRKGRPYGSVTRGAVKRVVRGVRPYEFFAIQIFAIKKGCR